MTFRELLTTTLAAVERDAPESGRRAADALGYRRTVLRVGDEVISLTTQHERLMLDSRRHEDPEIEITTITPILIDIVEGSQTLLDAVDADRLRVKASAQCLLALDTAVRCLIAGALQTPTTPRSWEHFRTSQAAGAAGTTARKAEAA